MDSTHRVIELLEFSDEIFYKIFANFNDFDLLKATRVCKRFESIAKETFANKYNGESKEKYYDIKVFTDDTLYDLKTSHTFLETFGNEIAAINFMSEQRPNEYSMVKLIGRRCKSSKYLNISARMDYELNISQLIRTMTKLTSLTVKAVRSINFDWTDIRFPHLTTFAMDNVQDMDVQVLKQFLCMNPRMEHLRIIDCPNFPLNVIESFRDQLKTLKSLEYNTNSNSFGESCCDINMERLEKLKVSVGATSFRTVLAAIARGSKMIQDLEVLMRDDETKPDGIHNQMDDVIPLFDKLTSLRLVRFDLTVDVTRCLIQFLPHLAALKLDDVQLHEFHSRDILFIFKKCKHMKELVLESSAHSIKTEEFNLEFHREFTEIIRNRGDGVKFKVIQSGKKMIITAEKIIKNGELFYWNEYEALNSRSKVHFLDLSDECLSRIYIYLDEQGERGLYETCTRTRQAMHDQIAKQVFTVSDLDSARDTFKRFGEHIMKLAIDLNESNRAQTAAAWNYIGTEFGEKITELSLVNVKVSAVESLRISFPNLITLKIMSVMTSRTHILPPMDCPKLTHIEFHEGDIKYATKASNIGVTVDQLTTIKFNVINRNVVKILHLLDDRVCDQIQKITINHKIHRYNDDGKPTHANILFANIAMRFRNLSILNFCMGDIQQTNTKHLFASCPKIVKLSMEYNLYMERDQWRQTIRNIKEYCKHLEEIQLLTYSYCDGLEDEHLDEIINAFPRVQLVIIIIDDDNDTFKKETYKRITQSDRILSV